MRDLEGIKILNITGLEFENVVISGDGSTVVSLDPSIQANENTSVISTSWNNTKSTIIRQTNDSYSIIPSVQADVSSSYMIVSSKQ